MQPDKPCRNGRCVPHLWSFKCECDKGFLPSKNGKKCVVGQSFIIIISVIIRHFEIIRELVCKQFFL